MPSLSELPGDLSRTKFIKALTRLGFIIDQKGGKGDHLKATWPKTQKSTTVQGDLRKDVLQYVLRQIEINTSGAVTWQDIKKEL
ncbi:hypothetical protein A3H75_00760 [Candidatus Uhrbacteria bacterium RIFCSPLOWO2_02_FULL_51_9]|uniref:Addiction module toxin, HicA family n=1 Tax=Candidatus Uhrbacteria bacterium RIFCSPLOWO2_02_FULL_51_9 TaxID=1802410 RepID=A0A1F7VER5_9BACT|nr:MAG: hypothetical protein A3H75_00760 [Candidatus Uhrbacteria bacterium RIFCSPLOWO2_02_FULL_51_9]